jgi:hypothetical protein
MIISVLTIVYRTHYIEAQVSQEDTNPFNHIDHEDDPID